jgi:hypothetical protein
VSEGTRRDLVRRGLSGAGAVLASGAVPSLIGTAPAFADAGDDAAILESAIAVEQAAVLAHATGYRSGLLEKPVAAIAKLFAEQGREHVEALAGSLLELGGTVPEPPVVADVEGLAAVRSQTDFLNLAVELENIGVAAYGQAQRKLESADLLHMATQISANEGQHLVVLRQALGAGAAEAVPVAFEAGVSPPPDSGGG